MIMPYILGCCQGLCASTWDWNGVVGHNFLQSPDSLGLVCMHEPRGKTIGPQEQDR